MASSDLERWSRFWQQGHITTFGAGKANNYEGAVRAFWARQFSALPEGARILDIATGNGAIATLAAEISESANRDFFIAATDLAEISSEVRGGTQASRLRNRIHFHSHTPCERQPFADGSFDCVTSQFGFEYSKIEKTLPEIRRVLAPGGRFLAISHHADSRPIQRSRDELRVYRSALDELDLFRKLKEYLAALGDLSGPGDAVAARLEHARPLSRRFNTLMESFRQRHSNEDCAREIVGAISHLARGARSTGLEDLLARVDDSGREFRYARDRLADMVDSAFDDAGIERLEKIARSAGFEATECQPFHSEDNRLAGWEIRIS